MNAGSLMCEDLLSTNLSANAVGLLVASIVETKQTTNKVGRMASNSIAFYTSIANGQTKTQHSLLLNSQLETC